MARSAPTFDSGVIPVAVSGNQVALMAKIVEKLTQHQSNGEQAWELANLIAAAPDYEAVFHSVGDRSLGSGSNKGDTDIWLYLHHSSPTAYVAKLAQDYSPTSGAWTNAYREAGSSSNFGSSVSDTAEVAWWSICGEYQFIFIWLQSGTYSMLDVGQPIRPYSAALNGVARITSQSGTGNGVTIGVDRDISASLKAGQGVWLLNQTPDLTPIQSEAPNLVTVVSAGASSIVVDNVTGTFAVGSLIGIDPAPSYYRYGGSINTPYFTSLMNGNWTSATGQPGTVINPGAAAVTEGNFDPGPDQLYAGFQPYIKMVATPAGFRGKIQHIRSFTRGAQIDGDVMEVDYDTNQHWKVWSVSALNGFTAWMTGYGPGAGIS